MDIKIIKSEKDYDAAIERLSALMSCDIQPDSSEESEMELLTLVIAEYERKTVPDIKPDPIEAILFRMDQMGLQRKDLVPYLGSLSKVSEVLTRKRSLSLPMIRRLHKGLDIPAEILIEDVAVLDEEPEIDYTRFPLKEMFERGYFGDFPGGVRRVKEFAEELMTKFAQPFMHKQESRLLLRAPMHQRGSRQADEMALRAWRLCVLRRAKEAASVREYKPESITLELMQKLARLSVFEEGPKLAREFLARYGIVLVIEPHFNRTFLDGAAMLEDGRPIIALTLRHDRLDNFWFALMHELAHVAKHLGPDHVLFMDDLDGQSSELLEAEADEMAKDALIPPERWAEATVRTTLTTADVVAFADEVGINPAIVAGRLRYEQNDYRLFNHLIGKKGQVSAIFSS